MLAAERRQKLLDDLARQGKVNAAAAAADLQISVESIRKDLILLENQGLLTRVHGGALQASPMTFEPDVDSRDDNLNEKARIAQAALAYVPEGGAIAVDAGSTAMELIRRLPNKPLRVFTTSLTVASAASRLSQISVSTFGGQVRHSTSAQVGPLALRAIEPMHFDMAFVGTNALTVQHGLATPDEQEAAVKAALINHAERAVLLADHTKFGRRSLVSYAEVASLDTIVTDTELLPEFQQELADIDVQVELV